MILFYYYIVARKVLAMSGTSKKEKEIELLHTILQHCDGSIFVTDGEGRIIFSNDESSQALGLATEDLLHMTIYDLVDAGITKGAVSVKVIERRCPVTDRVYYPGHRENIVTGTPVFDDSGNLIMVVVYGQGKKSISERIKFLEERDNAFSQAVDKLLDFQSESHIVLESPTTKRASPWLKMLPPGQLQSCSMGNLEAAKRLWLALFTIIATEHRGCFYLSTARRFRWN